MIWLYTCSRSEISNRDRPRRSRHGQRSREHSSSSAARSRTAEHRRTTQTVGAPYPATACHFREASHSEMDLVALQEWRQARAHSFPHSRVSQPELVHRTCFATPSEVMLECAIADGAHAARSRHMLAYAVPRP